MIQRMETRTKKNGVDITGQWWVDDLFITTLTMCAFSNHVCRDSNRALVNGNAISVKNWSDSQLNKTTKTTCWTSTLNATLRWDRHSCYHLHNHHRLYHGQLQIKKTTEETKKAKASDNLFIATLALCAFTYHVCRASKRANAIGYIAISVQKWRDSQGNSVFIWTYS